MPVLQRFDFARQLPAGAVTGFKRAFCEAKEGGQGREDEGNDEGVAGGFSPSSKTVWSTARINSIKQLHYEK